MSLEIENKKNQKIRNFSYNQDSKAQNEDDSFSKKNVFASLRYPIETLTEERRLNGREKLEFKGRD